MFDGQVIEQGDVVAPETVTLAVELLSSGRLSGVVLVALAVFEITVPTGVAGSIV